MSNKDIDIIEFCAKCNITIKEFTDLMKNDADIDPIIIGKVIRVLQVNLIDILE